MRDGHQLQPIDEHRLFELVGDAQVELAVPLAQLARADAHVLVRVGHVLRARARPRAHLSAAHEIGHELEPFAVPRVEVRAGRRLAIELGDRHHRGVGPRPRRRQLDFRLEDAGRPQHAHDVGALASAQSEQDVGRSSGGGSRRGLNLLQQAAGAQLHLGADAAAVARAPLQPHAERGAPVAAVVSPDAHAPAGGAREHVGVAVAVDVAGGECQCAIVRAAERCRQRRCGDVNPRVADISKQPRPAVGQREQIDDAVVVVVEELRGKCAGRIRRRLGHGEAACAGTDRKGARGVGAAEEKVGDAVLVDVGRRHRRERRRGWQPDIAGDVAEGAVAQVAQERRPIAVADDEEVDVAVVVVVGRHDRDGMRAAAREARFGRRVAEPAVAGIAQQLIWRRLKVARKHHLAVSRGRRLGPGEAGEHEIEIAVVIDVGERGSACNRGRRRQSGGGGHILEGPVGRLMKQAVRRPADDEEVGAAVVVVVGRDRCDRRRARNLDIQSCGGLEARAAVPPDEHARAGDGDQVELAVRIHIRERQPGCRSGRDPAEHGVVAAAGVDAVAERHRAARRPRAEITRSRERHGGIREGDRRHGRIDQARLEARGRDRFRVSPLPQVDR